MKKTSYRTIKSNGDSGEAGIVGASLTQARQCSDLLSFLWLPSIMTSLTLGCRYSVRVSPQMANRIVDSARSILNKFIPDIYIYTDHMKGVNSGK